MLHRKPCRKKQSGARRGPLRAPAPSHTINIRNMRARRAASPPRMLYYTVIKYILLYKLYTNAHTLRVKMFKTLLHHLPLILYRDGRHIYSTSCIKHLH